MSGEVYLVYLQTLWCNGEERQNIAKPVTPICETLCSNFNLLGFDNNFKQSNHTLFICVHRVSSFSPLQWPVYKCIHIYIYMYIVGLGPQLAGFGPCCWFFFIATVCYSNIQKHLHTCQMLSRHSSSWLFYAAPHSYIYIYIYIVLPESSMPPYIVT